MLAPDLSLTDNDGRVATLRNVFTPLWTEGIICCDSFTKIQQAVKKGPTISMRATPVETPA